MVSFCLAPHKFGALQGGHSEQTETNKMATLLPICLARQIAGMRLGTKEDQHESNTKGKHRRSKGKTE